MLEGEKIRLRAIEFSDGERVQRWVNEGGALMTGRAPVVISKKALEKLYERSLTVEATPTRVEMAVDTHDGRNIGLVQIDNIDWVHRHGSLYVLIGEPDYRGRGFEEDAIRTVAAYGFRLLHLNRLSAGVIGEGNRMQKCLENAGFRVEGKNEAYYWSGTRYEDRVCLRLLASEFERSNAEAN